MGTVDRAAYGHVGRSIVAQVQRRAHGDVASHGGACPQVKRHHTRRGEAASVVRGRRLHPNGAGAGGEKTNGLRKMVARACL